MLGLQAVLEQLRVIALLHQLLFRLLVVIIQQQLRGPLLEGQLLLLGGLPSSFFCFGLLQQKELVVVLTAELQGLLFHTLVDLHAQLGLLFIRLLVQTVRPLLQPPRKRLLQLIQLHIQALHALQLALPDLLRVRQQMAR